MQTQTYLIVALVVVVALVMGIIVLMPTDQAYKSERGRTAVEPAVATPVALPAATPVPIKSATRRMTRPAAGVRSETPAQAPLPGDLAPAGEPVTGAFQSPADDASTSPDLIIEGQNAPISPAQPQ